MRLDSRRSWGAVAVLAALLLAAASALAWNRVVNGRSRRALSHSTPIVVAVAPFRSVGEGVEPWSGPGLSDQVRRALEGVPGLVVRPTFEAPPAPLPPQSETSESPVEVLAAFGRGLRASYALGGTVGRNGQRSEIGVQLVRVPDGAVVWTAAFWREPGRLHSFASELAAVVAEALQAERPLLENAPPTKTAR